MTVASQLVDRGLPNLFQQSRTADPIVFVKLVCAGSPWACFVAEASYLNDSFNIYGYFRGEVSTWAQLPLEALERVSRERGNVLSVDPEFRPIRFSEIRD